METARYADFSMASNTLNTALLASVGEKNRNHLKTTFPALKLYMLTPRDIVDTMCAKHGVATSDDISKLRDPLSRALTSLSDLTDHMDSFLLASQRLTRSGQGETDYRYEHRIPYSYSEILYKIQVKFTIAIAYPDENPKMLLPNVNH
jgi:hypothetical protein